MTTSSRSSRFSASGPLRGLLAAAQRVAVIADAIGQQEIQMRILPGQALRRGAILGDEAAGQARQQILRAIAQTVGQAQTIAEPRDDAGLRADGARVRRCRRGSAVRMHQERRAPVDIGAHQVDAALGLLPILAPPRTPARRAEILRRRFS